METTNQFDFSSPAWLLAGLVHSMPGKLDFQDERLSFTAHGPGTFGSRRLDKFEKQVARPGLASSLKSGGPGLVFDVHLSNVERVYFPWWYFEAGMKLTIHGVEYRFSFVKPQNTQGPAPRTSMMDVMENGLDLTGGIGTARMYGKRWKELLTLS